jgi:hypothetical protein
MVIDANNIAAGIRIWEGPVIPNTFKYGLIMGEL